MPLRHSLLPALAQLYRQPASRSGQVLPGERELNCNKENPQLTDASKENEEGSQNTHALEAQRDGPNAAPAQYSTSYPCLNCQEYYGSATKRKHSTG